MLKKIILYTLGTILVLAIGLGLYFREELVRLNIVITMFEPENISKNFKTFPEFVNTAVVEASPNPSELPVADTWSLPEKFQLG